MVGALTPKILSDILKSKLVKTNCLVLQMGKVSAMNHDNKQFWQRMAKLYAPFMKSSNQLYADICKRIEPHLNRQMNVLELACGSGQLSFRLATEVQLWEATDFSENMIAEAKKQRRPSRLHFSVQDATNLPYEPECFDAVVISNALHIMPYPDRALAEIHRVLKPNGRLFAPTFVHGEGAGYRIRSRILELSGFKTYHKWNTREFTDFISRHGFTVMEQAAMGSNIVPLCYLEAQKKNSIR